MKQLIPQPIKKMLISTLRQLRTKYEISRYKPKQILSSVEGNEKIAEIVAKGNPAAIGKIGNAELQALVFYQKILKGYQNHKELMNSANILNGSPGVFPLNESIFKNFCSHFLEVLSYMDYLAVWYNPGEAQIINSHAPKAILSELRSLEPYYHPNPWSQKLENKKVLIIHPFTDSIEKQYQKRNDVWQNRSIVLPEFSLRTLKTPLHARIVKPQFKDWFETLEALKNQMSEIEFDIAIIGAGAWSLPLVVHAKNLDKIGIHLGGATQILFGIKGGRWDNHNIISTFYNDAWCRPSASETPLKYETVEQGHYW